MSGENELPSEEELHRLSQASVAVYALRCALRVQPLLTSRPNPITEPNTTEPWLIEYITASYKESVVKLNTAYNNLVHGGSGQTYRFTGFDVFGLGFMVFQIAERSAGFKKDTSLVRAAISVSSAGMAISRAHTIGKGSEVLEYKPDDLEKIRLSTYIAADKAARYAKDSANDSTFISSARADYTRLLGLNEEVIDASETGPLGNLWIGSQPDWYINAKDLYEKTITEWEQEIA